MRQRVFSIVQSDGGTRAGKVFDIFIMIMIALNVGLVILDTFTLPDYMQTVSVWFDRISVVIFTAEYLLRLWTSDFLRPELPRWMARLLYAVSFMAIIDLLAILPFYIPFLIPIDLRVLRILRVVRIFRLFKVNRYTSAFSLIGGVLRSKASQLSSSVFIVLLLMIISSVLMYSVENPVQPDVFKNAFSGLWWSVATFTTVGYGDIFPVTAAGKVISAIIALLGIGLVAVPTGIISAGFVEALSVGSRDKEFCPYCGEKL